MVLSLSFTTAFAAAEEKESTSNWLPQKYMLDGYEIPTVMTYDAQNGSVSFKGGLNAGIATTGFSYAKPIDVTNFSIKMTWNIPDIDQLTWICFTFLDSLTAYDDGNPVPVNMPFNAFKGRNNYENNVQTGGVLQFWTEKLLSDNVISVSYNEKNLDNVTGAKTTTGWKDITNGNFASVIQLDEAYNGEFSLSLTANEDGVAFNVFDGAWKGQSLENEEVFESLACLNAGNTLFGLKDYFAKNDCYFSMLLMYKDGNHRNVELKVTEVDGKLACDGTTPTYLNDKTVTADGITATVKNDVIGNFGVYAGQIDGLKKTVYDDEDDDYAAVAARAEKTQTEILDFFSVSPTVEGKEIYLNGYFDAEYTLPDGYGEFKFYYINEDGEAEALADSFAVEENGVLKFKTDNANIEKIAILGKKASGCGGNVSGASALLCLAAILPVVIAIKKKEC